MDNTDYALMAEQIQGHPYFGRHQKILKGPKITFQGETLEDRIFSRSAIIGDHSTHISVTRALRPRYIGEIIAKRTDQSGCIFCYPDVTKVTTEPKIYHYFSSGGFQPLSFYNLYGLDEVSMITVFAGHKSQLKELTFDDLVSYMESLYELSHFLKKEHNACHVWEFINWGPLAGASQEHPHAQRGTGPFNPVIEQEALQIARLTYREGNDPFETYKKELKESPYFIWESEEPDGLFIHAPFAPILPHQVDVFPKQRIHHILELTDLGQRVRIARSMLGVFQALHEKLGVTDLNVALHQEFFNVESNYRLHWHFYPRNLNKLAGIEIGHGTYIVNVFPEETADVLRKHYRTKQ